MESSRAFAVLVVLVAVAVILLVRQLLLLLYNRKLKLEIGQLPPGPRGLPWLGNLLSFRSSNMDTLRLAKAWTEQYGPLVTVRLGVLPFIFVTGREQVKEVLLAAGGRFDSRPYHTSKLVLTNNHRSINSSPYGGRWRELRKNLNSRVLGQSRVAALAQVRSAHLDTMVRRLREQLPMAIAVQEGGPEAKLLVSVREQIRLSAFHMLLHVIFGKTLEEEQVRAIDESIQRMLPLAVGLGNVGDFIPLIAPLVHRRHNRRLLAARSKLEEIALPLVAQIRDSRLAGTPIAPGSYIDSLVQLEERGQVESGDYIVLCTELLSAGTDTMSSAIEFAMAELVKAPEVQAELVARIAAACGGDQLQQQEPLDPSRFKAVPYLRAVVLEMTTRPAPSPARHLHLASPGIAR